MGAGASRKYVVEEIRAATQADVARACAELSTQDKDKLIVLLEASEQVAQFIEQLAATIRTRRRRRRRRPIGRSNWSNKLYCVRRQWHTCLSSLQSSQKRPTPTFSLNTKGEALRTSAELALRWSAHRLEQAVHARCSKILRPGTAILQKGRCIEQLPQRASCIACCAGLGWLHTVNQLRS